MTLQLTGPRFALMAAAIVTSSLCVTVEASATQVDTVARFGGIDEAGGLISFRPRAASLRPSSAVLAQGDGIFELRFDGTSRRLAREGEGPGEVQMAWSVAVSDATIRFFDTRLLRLTALDLPNRKTTTGSFPSVSILQGRQGFGLSDGSLLSYGGTFLERPLRSRVYNGADVLVWLDTLHVVRHLRGDQHVEVGMFPATTRYQTGSGGFFAPGHPRLMPSIANDRLLLARSHEPNFVVINPISNERWDGRASVASRPFDPKLHQALVEEFLSVQGSGFVIAGVPTTENPVRRLVVEKAGHPDTAPLFDEAQLSQSGEVWLRHVEQPMPASRTWRVVSPTGPDRLIRLPSDLKVLAIDEGFIVGVSRDNLDVATVLILSVRD